MPKGAELKAMIPWILDNVQDGEPFVLRFPRREASKRIENKEKKRRIVMQTDEQNYVEFQVWREAYMQKLDENPTLVTQAIIEAMKAFDLLAWRDEQRETADKFSEGLESA